MSETPVYDLIIALAKDQTSNHRQIIDLLTVIHEQQVLQQGILMGMRSLIEARSNRIESFLRDAGVKQARSDTKPLDLSGGPR